MQPGAPDGGRHGASSRSARPYPARSHGNGDLPIHHWVTDVSEPMHALRHHLRRQPLSPSHEQAIQVPYDSSQATPPIPEGKCVLTRRDQTGCFQFTGFCDASWGNYPGNGKSTSRYLFMMAGGPLSFKITIQSVTAQSTMEADGPCKQRGGLSLQNDS